MNTLVYVLIYAGSALMVYNIVRCHGFVKRMRSMRGLEKTHAILPVPLVLLACFLVGYLAVALFGTPDLIIAGILFGGSVFVFVVFGVMYQIIDRLSESNARSDALYEEIRSEMTDLTRDYVSVLRVNLTTDAVEDRSGAGLTPDDLQATTYTELLEARRSRLVPSDGGPLDERLFSRESLLESFAVGQHEVTETLLVRNAEGEPCFVRMQAALAMQPGTGDTVAFITETVCNDEVVNEVLLNRALIGQYDAIASLVGGTYRIVIGNGDGRVRGSLFPASRQGSYEAYLTGQVGPAICGSEDEREALVDALRPASIERGLEAREPYSVNVAVTVGGELFHKRFDFYAVDRTAGFYLLLKSDTTDARREEMDRSALLADALEDAQHASRSKTVFLSNISHDIRTPMNAIVGYTEFAKNCDDPDQVHDYLEKIDSSSKYMLALLNDVLEMSRIESGKTELDIVRASLPVLMADARSLFERQMAEKRIAYTVDASRVTDGCVFCDKTRLNRVLLNLISNAYKFTPEGGAVDVTLAQLPGAPDGRGSYELRVKDSGIGMSPEFAERVFEAFERERTATASGIQGTGLGMSITKNIVELMGGTIEVFTEQGVGTEFVVRFELELQKRDPSFAWDEMTCQPVRQAVDLSGKRVLLAEDHAVNREIAVMMLESLGLSVDAAVDGGEALDMLCAAGPGCYDVVVTDIQMPVMDGYGLARAIRALDDASLARIPVVAMSANAFAEDVKASREAGMDGHIAKPIDLGVLTETLSDVLRRPR